jgi:phosphoribosyl-ATP pyrophosphohydrolase
MNPGDVLNQLYATLEARKTADPQTSYAASLYAKGTDAILKKIGEEATETVIAAKNAEPQALVHEMADLWYHTLVLLAHRDLPLTALTDELARRFGQSGHAEKAARSK